jgi:hypothetical protein
MESDPAMLQAAASVNPEFEAIGSVLRFARSTAVGYVPGAENPSEPANPAVPPAPPMPHKDPYADARGLTVDPEKLPGWFADMGGDTHITDIQVGDGGGEKNALIGFFSDDNGQELFMVTNLNHGANLPAAGAAETIEVFFDSSVASLLSIDRATGEERIVNLDYYDPTHNVLTVSLPGGTGELYKYDNGFGFYAPTLTWAGGSGNWLDAAPPKRPQITALFTIESKLGGEGGGSSRFAVWPRHWSPVPPYMLNVPPLGGPGPLDDIDGRAFGRPAHVGQADVNLVEVVVVGRANLLDADVPFRNCHHPLKRAAA